MRIAEIAPPWLPVPPWDYGGIELVVSILTDQLVQSGHDVTLFASGGSDTRASLVTPLDVAPGVGGDRHLELLHLIEAYERASEFDLIHDHTPGGTAIASLLHDGPPVVHTLHGPWTDATRRFYERLDHSVHLIAISRTQMESNTDIRYAGMVYNGIDLSSYRFAEEKGDYLCFIGRCSSEKAPEVAVEVAARAGVPLKMAVARSEPAQEEHWEREVVPRLRGDEEIHELAEHDQKVELLSRARATLFPIQWPEPFGLVMVESMACGTPVLAFPRGAAQEVVEHGRTGFLSRNLEAMVEDVANVGAISPAACRERVRERFSKDAMATGYERVFESLVRRRP